MQALIIGGTGATGRVLVEQLLEDSDFSEVTIFVRKDPNIQHPKLITHIVDFEHITEWQHLIVGDTAFSCLGTTIKQAGSKENQWHIDHDYVLRFAEYARQNSVKQFVLLSAKSASAQSKIFYSRLKGTLENNILALRFNQTIILKPGLLLRPNSDRAGELLAEKVLKFFNALGLLKNMQPLDVAKVAKRMRTESKDCNEPQCIILSEQI